MNLTQLTAAIHGNAKARGWHDEGPKNDRFPTLLCLVHAEVSEALRVSALPTPASTRSMRVRKPNSFHRPRVPAARDTRPTPISARTRRNGRRRRSSAAMPAAPCRDS